MTAAAAYGASYLVPREAISISVCGARSQAPAALQRVGADLANRRFQVGDWFEWEYRDDQGLTSSRERYVIRSVSGPELIIDMESKLHEREDFQAHHRIHLSLADALNAKDDRKQWSLIKFGFHRDGRWLEAPYTDNVQAFEEKFDCFLMAAGLPEEERQYVDVATGGATRRAFDAVGDARGDATLVRTPRHEYSGAWYISEPEEHAGVAAFKAFGVEGAPGTYTFQLVATGRMEA